MRNLIVALALVACGSKKLAPKNPYAVGRQQAEVALTDDVSTRAALTYPESGSGPHPTVILVHDAGPLDMDHTLVGPGQPVLLFSDLSEALSEQGFAVVRYHKRHVAGFQEHDLRRFVLDDTPRTHAEDLQRVLAWARTQPRVDPEQVFLYGVGEGAQVAGEVARNDTVAGLVLHGAPGEPYPVRMRAWFDDLVVPYLEGIGYNGMLDGRLLAEAMNAPVSPPIRECTSMLAVSYTRGSSRVKISPLVDLNRDGLLEIETELEPRIPELVDLAFGPIGNLRQHAGPGALPTLDQVVGELATTPVLLLHGMSDATVRFASAQNIEEALKEHPDHELALFRYRGHTLGPARGVGDDLPRPMDPEVVEKLVDWLVRHAK